MGKRKGYLIEVCIRKSRELLLDRLQKPNSNVNTVVSAMCLLSLEPHGSKWPTSFGSLVESTSRVPSATKTAPYQYNIHSLIKTCRRPPIIQQHISKGSLRKSKHQRSTILLSNKPSKLPFGFLNSLLILLTHSWVALSHCRSSVTNRGKTSFTLLQMSNKYTKYMSIIYPQTRQTKKHSKPYLIIY